MKNNAREILFGRYPRTVASKTANGALKQTFVHGDAERDIFIDTLKDQRDLYSSICTFDPSMNPKLGNVPFDFDSEMKDTFWSDNIPERQKIEEMRDDENVADNVLGPVWEDAQSLVEKCREENLPVVTVFSGMGVHCHVLFKPEYNIEEEKISTTEWLVSECGLKTWDRKIKTDMRRVLRIPNSKRFDSGDFTGLYNIPITEEEVLKNSIHDLLERSREPKDIALKDRYLVENRPEMIKRKGYEDVDYSEECVEIEVNPNAEREEWVDWVIEECIPLPCLSKRFKAHNPDNFVRMSGVVHLFNAGFSPSEVVEIIESLRWRDYNREKTSYYVKQIHKKGYSDPKCETLQHKGLCVYEPEFEEYSDDETECPTHGWSAGKCEWQ